MRAQTIKPIEKRAAAMSPIKCQSVRAPRNPIVLRDSAISSSDIHATTKSPRFSRHRVPWAIAPSHARWPWPSARRISRPYRAAFYAQRRRPHQRVSTRSILTHSLTPPSLALSHHGINHKQIAARNIIAASHQRRVDDAANCSISVTFNSVSPNAIGSFSIYRLESPVTRRGVRPTEPHQHSVDGPAGPTVISPACANRVLCPTVPVDYDPLTTEL